MERLNSHGTIAARTERDEGGVRDGSMEKKQKKEVKYLGEKRKRLPLLSSLSLFLSLALALVLALARTRQRVYLA